MLSKDQIMRIVRSGAQAPSGDNAQPWRFEVRGNDIDLFNIPGQDRSPYNFRERGSFFAHGAVIENIVIAASAVRCSVAVSLFPAAADPNHVAHLRVSETGATPDPLYACLETRATNRRPYHKRPLSIGHYAELAKLAASGGGVTILLVHEPEKIKAFAATVSLSDQLIFQEKSIHDAIFGSIRWSAAEEKRERGMYLKTLELPPPARAMFRVLRSWKTLAVLNRVGISKFIRAQSAAVYATAPVIGMVIIPEAANERYVAAGRLFERFWLTATLFGVSIQPMAALAYLAGRVAAGDAGELSADHAEAVIKAQDAVNALFGKKEGVVAMMFRMGYAAAPSAHSRKMEPHVMFKES